MEDEGLEQALTVFEKQLADQYARQCFKDQTRAYLALRPGTQENSAKSYASTLFTRPRVQAYLKTLQGITPEETKSVRKVFLEKVNRITQKAEDKEQYGQALKGCELEAKVEGLFNQDDSDTEQYKNFFNKVSIVQNITVNQGNKADEARVIEGTTE